MPFSGGSPHTLRPASTPGRRSDGSASEGRGRPGGVRPDRSLAVGRRRRPSPAHAHPASRRPGREKTVTSAKIRCVNRASGSHRWSTFSSVAEGEPEVAPEAGGRETEARRHRMAGAFGLQVPRDRPPDLRVGGPPFARQRAKRPHRATPGWWVRRSSRKTAGHVRKAGPRVPRQRWHCPRSVGPRSDRRWGPGAPRGLRLRPRLARGSRRPRPLAACSSPVAPLTADGVRRRYAPGSWHTPVSS
jgi:hypothetical protein